MNISDLDHLDVIVETSNILGGEAYFWTDPLVAANSTTSLAMANISRTDISSYFNDGKGLTVLYQNGSNSEAGKKSYSLSAVWTAPAADSSISLSSVVKVS